MSFSNFIREDDDRTIKNHPVSGWVVNNTDPNKNQRIQARVHVLDDQIEDADLTWFSPYQLSGASGSENIGDHGPIPPVGAKIWLYFGDSSHYHGVYGGGVASTQNQIPEFTQGQKVNVPGGVQYDFSQNYPHPLGGIDTSGSIGANDQHTDVRTDIHVAGTGSTIDGKGNHAYTVNGNASRSDNPNAQAILPTGGTYAIFGNMTLYVSGNMSISVQGNTNLTTAGTTTIQSVGELQVLNNDELDVMSSSSSKALYISSAFKIALQAPTITSSVPITVADGKPPITVSAPAVQTSSTKRTRPNIQVTQNDLNYDT